MNGLESLLGQQAVLRVGWALLHFLWQGAIVALLLAGGLRLLRRQPATTRHLTAGAAMLLLLALPVGTLVRSSSELNGVVERLSVVPAATEGTVEVRDVSEQDRTVVRPPGASPPVGDLVGNRWAGRAEAAVGSLLPWAVLAWMLGVLVLAMRLVGAALLVRRLGESTATEVGQRWRLVAARLGAHLGLRGPVPIRGSRRTAVPVVTGLFRPVVWMPVGALSRLAPRQVEMILAHELAHIRRRDPLANLLQTTIETLLFFHPAVWYVSRLVRREREYCCDDLAVDACGDANGYARALVEIEELRQADPQLVIAAAHGSLSRRIHRLLDLRGRPGRSGSRPSRAVAVSILLVSLALVVAGSYGARVPELRERPPATWEEYRGRIRRALEAGDDATAMEISAMRPKAKLGRWGSRASVELTLDLDDAMHRRYEEVFEPPANIENLVPRFRWKRFGRYSSFSSISGGGIAVRSELEEGIRTVVYSRPGARPDSAVLRIERGEDHFQLILDLDHDGRVDLTFDGHDATLGEGPSYAVDRAPDGRRAQWLFAPAGTDPRREASFFLYRDGDFFLYLFDADGDGKGDLGRSQYLGAGR